jgi:hypothetical protein
MLNFLSYCKFQVEVTKLILYVVEGIAIVKMSVVLMEANVNSYSKLSCTMVLRRVPRLLASKADWCGGDSPGN